MANLKFDGRPSDATFQKSLDTFAKRHHIRLWREEQSDVWLGAATEDIKCKVRALRVTHDTDRYIDNERAKVVNDLVFTGCVDRGALVPRGSRGRSETAHSVLTDSDVAVLQLNACESPHVMPSDLQTPRPVRIIRAALAVSEDIAHSTNPVSVVYAMTKSMFDSSKPRANERVPESCTYIRAISISSIRAITPTPSWPSDRPQ